MNDIKLIKVLLVIVFVSALISLVIFLLKNQVNIETEVITEDNDSEKTLGNLRLVYLKESSPESSRVDFENAIYYYDFEQDAEKHTLDSFNIMNPSGKFLNFPDSNFALFSHKGDKALYLKSGINFYELWLIDLQNMEPKPITKNLDYKFIGFGTTKEYTQGVKNPMYYLSWSKDDSLVRFRANESEIVYVDINNLSKQMTFTDKEKKLFGNDFQVKVNFAIPHHRGFTDYYSDNKEYNIRVWSKYYTSFGFIEHGKNEIRIKKGWKTLKVFRDFSGIIVWLNDNYHFFVLEAANFYLYNINGQLIKQFNGNLLDFYENKTG